VRILQGEDAVYRRFVVPLAIAASAALSAVLAPAAAQASTPASASVSTSDFASSPTGFWTTQAPASATVSHHVQQVPRAGSAATDPNPSLAVRWTSATGMIFGVDAYAAVSGYTTQTSGGLSAQVDWGDGTSSTYAHIGTNPDFKHTYKLLGSYAISVSISDGEGDGASADWSMQTYGSEYTPYNPMRILDTRNGLGSSAVPVAAKHSIGLKVVGAGDPANPIPADVTDVVLNVTATEGTANGFLSVYANEYNDGVPMTLPPTSNVSFRAGQDSANLVFAQVGYDGVVDFYNGASTGTVNVVADIEGYFTAANTNEYLNFAPTRILDTRKGIGTGTGTGTVQKVPANGSVTLTVAGAAHGLIPPTGATAVTVNLTAVDATRNGVLTAYPAGEPMPPVSNLNYAAGQTRANLAIVPLGKSGQIVLHNTSTGTVDLIADASGYFTPAPATGGNAYVDTQPERSLNSGIKSGSPREIEPAWGSYWFTSMVFNATVTQAGGNGFLTLFPYNAQTPNSVPSVSNLNYLAGQTVSNLAVVAIGTVPGVPGNVPSPEIGVYLGGTGIARVILDFFGFFSNK